MELQPDAAGRGLRYAADTSKKVPNLQHYCTRYENPARPSLQAREARGTVHSARWPTCRAPFDHLRLLPLLPLVQCILPQYGGGIEPDLCAGRRRHWAHLARLQRQLSRQLLLSLQAVLCETSA